MENFDYSGYSYTTQESQDSVQNQLFQYLIYLMKCRDQLRMNHWQTTSYAEHKATDRLIGSYTEFIDQLGETTLGLLGRPSISTTNNEITDIKMFSSSAVLDSIEQYTTQIKELCESIENASDISNIIDEILGQTRVGKYLLTLE